MRIKAVCLMAMALFFCALGCGGEETEYCAYVVGFLDECDISRGTDAPRQENCVEFLAACNESYAFNSTQCKALGAVSRCTKFCSFDDTCAPGVCSETLGYCVPR